MLQYLKNVKDDDLKFYDASEKTYEYFTILMDKTNMKQDELAYRERHNEYNYNFIQEYYLIRMTGSMLDVVEIIKERISLFGIF